IGDRRGGAALEPDGRPFVHVATALKFRLVPAGPDDLDLVGRTCAHIDEPVVSEERAGADLDPVRTGSDRGSRERALRVYLHDAGARGLPHAIRFGAGAAGGG